MDGDGWSIRNGHYVDDPLVWTRSRESRLERRICWFLLGKGCWEGQSCEEERPREFEEAGGRLVVHSVQGVDSLRSVLVQDDWRHERVTRAITIRESGKNIKERYARRAKGIKERKVGPGCYGQDMVWYRAGLRRVAERVDGLKSPNHMKM
jgi:hypothetical protein